jgi:hypothetical protein
MFPTGNERLSLDMSAKDAIAALAEGNPGAMVAIGALMRDAKIVDPDHIFTVWAPAFALDTFGVYGFRIHMLLKDACKGDTTKCLAVLRAWQFGIVAPPSEADKVDADTFLAYIKRLDVDDLFAQVQKRLPDFGKRGKKAS